MANPEIKSLKSKVSDLRLRVDVLKQEKERVNNDLIAANNVLNAAEAQLKNLQMLDSLTPSVSDHALMRYIERVYNIDLDAVRKFILTDELKGAINAVPDGTINLGNNQYIVKGKKIITVINHGKK